MNYGLKNIIYTCKEKTASLTEFERAGYTQSAHTSETERNELTVNYKIEKLNREMVKNKPVLPFLCYSGKIEQNVNRMQIV